MSCRVKNRTGRLQHLFSAIFLLQVLLTGIDAYGLEKENVTDIFSDSYFDARQKFLDAASQHNAQLNSYKHPQQGPNGEKLFVDTALLGNPAAENFILLISGTHGVEGFAGSALQTGILRSNLISELTPPMGVLFIHALNPYGFAHLRRFNEDNVDLNRNFIPFNNTTPPVNTNYQKLSSAIAPDSISYTSNIKHLLHGLYFVLRHGPAALKKAISKGQYSHPKGLFYGGTAAAWSNQLLKEIASIHLSNAKRVIVLDIHTGLGDYGNAEVIINVPINSDPGKRAVKIWGDIVASTFEGEAVAEHITGSLKLAMPDFIPEAQVTAVSLEFGTVNSLKVFLALRTENWFHHNPAADPAGRQAAKIRLRNVFYPQEIDWKEQVWVKGKDAFVQAIKESTSP